MLKQWAAAFVTIGRHLMPLPARLRPSLRRPINLRRTPTMSAHRPGRLAHLPGGLPACRMRVFDQWRRNRGQVGFRRSGRRGAKYRVKPSAQPHQAPPSWCGCFDRSGVALNRAPRVRLWRFRELGRHRLRSIAPADVRRDEAQRTAFSVFRGAHLLRLTQRNLRSNSAAGNQPPHCSTPDPACARRA